MLFRSMADASERVRDFLNENPALEQAESIIAVSKAMPLGQIRKNARVQGPLLAGGAIGALVSHLRESKMSAEDLQSKMKMGVFLVATDRRLLLISAGGMRALPREHIGSVERSRITKIERGTTKVSLVKMMTVTFTLDDGSELSFEFPKVDAKDGERVLASFGA